MTIEEQLLKKFGTKGCISRAKTIAEERFQRMLRFEKGFERDLRSHCELALENEFREGNADKRVEMCLSDFGYANDAITVAALTKYIEDLKKESKKKAKRFL